MGILWRKSFILVEDQSHLSLIDKKFFKETALINRLLAERRPIYGKRKEEISVAS